MELVLTKNFKKPGEQPPDLREYEQGGGYQGLRAALQLAPAEVVAIVKNANLLGRGGAGFPAGLKWSLVAPGPQPSYLIANADEMEPGTFKDRFLMENDPHQLLEGMIIAAYAVQAEIAYLFIRGEYFKSIALLQDAIREAYAAGYLGRRILDSGFSLELHLHTSAGRYICGEETALLNSLEGKPANPRAKPPYPPVAGLFGKPTTVNNVETLCNVPHIVLRGAEWFKGLSLTGEGGTKIYGVSGKVKRPGAWELPLGTTLRELIEEHAGGMRDGFRFRAALPGGASTDFVIEEHLDTPMDFGSMKKTGSRLGTGTAIVLDDRTCPVGFLANLESFFARESCGWCTPCREGLPWIYRLLTALEEGRGAPQDLDLLLQHARLLGAPGHTYCALAPGAVAPLGSALRYFRKDFEEHLDKGCPRS